MSGHIRSYLMYHELQLDGRRLVDDRNSYALYAVKDHDFKAQLARIKDLKLQGMSVSEALAADPEQAGVAITFDDGCETDLIAAAPSLKEFGFHATFYVVVGNLGRRGYLATAQLRELADLGFEIGCHSMTHPYLTDVDASQLHIEIVEAKSRLEQLLGRRIEHFSCPGGRWNPEIAQVAREADYRSVATSRIASDSRQTDRFRLARSPIKRGLSLVRFSRLCQGKDLFMLRAQTASLSAAKAVIGNAIYEKIRSTLLDRG